MVGPQQTALQNKYRYTNLHGYSLLHEFAVVLMRGLWRSHHETLQYVSNFYLRCSQKLLLQSLSGRLEACKRGSSFLLFAVAQFLSLICLRVKADLFFWQNDSGFVIKAFLM